MSKLHITNGTIVDPAAGYEGYGDIVIEDGKILAVGHYSGESDFQVDASGCVVTPGLVDHHVHLYPLIPNGIPGEAVCFASGVTTVGDAGSTGYKTLGKHVNFLNESKLTIRCWLNVCAVGLSGLPEPEDVNPDHFDQGAICDVFAQYGQKLLGLKLRTSRAIVGELGYGPLDAVMNLAARLDVPVMVHCTDPPGPMEALLDRLGPGDILTHMYQNIGYTILDGSGKVSKAAHRARERGVLFEAADARAHFSFSVSQAALSEDFLPDIISTDLTCLGMYQRPAPFSMAMQVNKYLDMGLALQEVIRRCTELPAKVMGVFPRAGTLRIGQPADVAVFRQIQHPYLYGDRPFSHPDCVQRSGMVTLQPVLTIKDGEMVYRDITL